MNVLCRTLFCSAICFSSFTPTQAQTKRKVVARAQSSPKTKQPKVRHIPYYGWTQESWTGDERPYRRIRLDIEALAAKGQLTENVVRQYREISVGIFKPQNAYRWAYALYMFVINNVPDTNERNRKFREVGLILPQVPFPKTYEYARMRYLLQMESDPYSTYMRTLGKRLALRDPNDYLVKYNLIGTLIPRRYPQEKQLGLRYIQDLIRIDRNRAIPNVYLAEGRIYYSAFLGTKSQSDGNNAITAYRKYLRLTRPDNPYQRNATFMIKIIQDLQKKYAKS